MSVVLNNYLLYLSVLHHHIFPWYPVVVEPEKPVVSRVEAHPKAYVTNLDPRKGYVGLHITYRYNEGMGAVALTICVQLGHHDAVVRGIAH